MKKHILKLIIEYDGTMFAGWQVQPDERTVQGVLEESIEKVLHHPVKLIAAGRTDAGVHAAGQVAGFSTSAGITENRLKKALNGILPADVTVVDVECAREGFNARYDALSRTYRYMMSTRKVSVGRSYVWRIQYALDRELLREAAVCLTGACNLRGFSKGRDECDFSTIILENRWIFDNNLLIFEIEAVRFFHHAVRSIVGCMVEVARKKEPPDLLEQILETRDRQLAGPTAPARGLCLFKVDYGENQDVSKR